VLPILQFTCTRKTIGRCLVTFIAVNLTLLNLISHTIHPRSILCLSFRLHRVRIWIIYSELVAESKYNYSTSSFMCLLDSFKLFCSNFIMFYYMHGHANDVTLHHFEVTAIRFCGT
jgi:hypothetical protein